MRTFKIAILSLLTVLGIAGAGAGLYGVGYELGYNEVAYADPGPELIAQALLDAGAGPGVAAEPLGVVAVHEPIAPPPPPDVIDAPKESFAYARALWQRGGWQAAVCLVWMLAVFVAKRMTPADKDGDGKPDPEGWRGKTWAIGAGALAVLGPAAAVAMGLDGAAWTGVLVGVPVLIAAVMDVANPKRGAAKAVA